MEKIILDLNNFILNEQTNNKSLYKLFTHSLQQQGDKLICTLLLSNEFKFDELDRDLVFGACLNTNAKNQMIREIVKQKYDEKHAMNCVKTFMHNLWKKANDYKFKGKKMIFKCRLDLDDSQSRRYIDEMDKNNYYVGFFRNVLLMNFNDLKDVLTPDIIKAIDTHPRRIFLKKLLLDGSEINLKWSDFGQDVLEISKLIPSDLLFKISNESSMWYMNLDDGVVSMEKYS